MRKGVCVVCAMAVAGTVWAQNDRLDDDRGYRGGDVISRDRSTAPQQDSRVSGTQDEVTFKTETGETYSLRDLAAELRNLRSAVERTLPALRAFNEAQGGIDEDTATVSGAISEVLGALGGRETNGGGSTNLMSVLGGLLSTNAPGTLEPDQQTARQLLTIQRHLAEVEQALQSLNVAASPGPWEGPLDQRNEPLTPTGRDERRRDLNSDY